MIEEMNRPVPIRLVGWSVFGPGALLRAVYLDAPLREVRHHIRINIHVSNKYF